MKIEIKKKYNFNCDMDMYSLYVDGNYVDAKFDLAQLEKIVAYIKTNGKLPEEEIILTEII